MRNAEETWETSDLGTAAYVHMRGLSLLGSVRSANPHSRGARGATQWVFRFSDPEGLGDTYQIDYLNSECRAFDAAVRSMKKLIENNKRNS